jgi:hypothetical protein
VTLLRRFLAWPAVASTALAAGALPAPAQELKPAAVVSIASVEKNLSDIVYLTRIVGMEDTGKTAQLFGNALTAGMDKSRPSGLLIVPAGGNFQAVAFIPVTNLKLLLEVHKEQVGEPRDVGGSILEIGTDRKAFVKEQGGWAFVAEKKEQLGQLPADPAQLLGEMPTRYNVAVRVLAKNIPDQLKKSAIEQIREGMKQAMTAPPIPRGAQPIPGAPQPMPGALPNPSQAQQQLQMEEAVRQIERLVNDSEEVVFGFAVNPADKSVSIDASIIAREGTELGRQVALQTGLKSSFDGFLLPEASVSFRATAAVTDADAARAKEMFQAQRQQMTAALDMLALQATPEAAEAVKKLAARVMDLLETSAASKRVDQGGVVVLEPEAVNIALGAYFQDGAALESVVADAAKALHGQKAEDGSTFELVMNVGTHGDVKLHRGAFPGTKDVPISKQVFGEKVPFVIGTGKSAGYLAIGKDCEALLKKVIDRSTAQASQPVQPFQMTVSAIPIAKFYQSVNSNNPLVAPLIGSLIATLEEDGSDKLLVQGTAGPRTVAYRIEVQEGIIRTVGEIVKMMSAQFGAEPPQ